MQRSQHLFVKLTLDW